MGGGGSWLDEYKCKGVVMEGCYMGEISLRRTGLRWTRERDCMDKWVTELVGKGRRGSLGWKKAVGYE